MIKVTYTDEDRDNEIAWELWEIEIEYAKIKEGIAA